MDESKTVVTNIPAIMGDVARMHVTSQDDLLKEYIEAKPRKAKPRFNANGEEILCKHVRDAAGRLIQRLDGMPQRAKIVKDLVTGKKYWKVAGYWFSENYELPGHCPLCHDAGFTSLHELGKYLRDKKRVRSLSKRDPKPADMFIDNWGGFGIETPERGTARAWGVCHSDSIDPLDALILKETMSTPQFREMVRVDRSRRAVQKKALQGNVNRVEG